MMDPRKLYGVPNPTGTVDQPPTSEGYVSTARPAPVGFEDPVWVILPEHSTERPVGPLAWPAIHGNTLPTQGTRVTVIFDGEQVPKLVWWDGAQTGGTGPPGPEGKEGPRGLEGKE